MAGAEWMNRYVSIEKESVYGSEPAVSQTFGEVDDESFKATFDLLVRSDMARQVASKAVTNTRYTEGSINFAVQPDDFMGNVLASFFPKRKHNTFFDSITFDTGTANEGGRGYGFHAGSGKIIDDSASDEHIGYWEVRNGVQAVMNASTLDASGLNGQEADVITLSATAAAGWSTVGGKAVSTSNPGYGILGSPIAAATSNTGFYFSYGGVSGATLTHVQVYTYEFATATGDGTVTASLPVLQYYNGVKSHGIEPGRVYGYVTEYLGSGLNPSGALTLQMPTSSAGNDFVGIQTLDQTGAVMPTGGTANMGGSTKHIFLEPTLTTESYPSYTVRVGREAKEHTFCGMCTTRLSLSANLNEYVMASVDFLGQAEKDPDTINTMATDTFSGNDVDALHFSGAELYIDGLEAKTTKIQSVSLEININRDLDSAYAVGSNSITRMPPTRTREITGTMEFNEIVYTGDADSSGAASTLGEPTYKELATATKVHEIYGGLGRPALKFKFQDADKDDSDFIEINLFNVRFEAPTASVSGRDPARMSVGFQAFYDAKATGGKKAIEVKMKGAQLQTSDY